MARGPRSPSADGLGYADELSFIRTHKCDEAQGYLFSRPIPGPDFMALLALSRLEPIASAVPRPRRRALGMNGSRSAADGPARAVAR